MKICTNRKNVQVGQLSPFQAQINNVVVQVLARWFEQVHRIAVDDHGFRAHRREDLEFCMASIIVRVRVVFMVELVESMPRVVYGLVRGCERHREHVAVSEICLLHLGR